MWLLHVSFAISEVSSLVLGYVTCLVLSVRPHGDWVMSFQEHPKRCESRMCVRLRANACPVFLTIFSPSIRYKSHDICSITKVTGRC
jgi:hypothetical protein